MIRLFAFFIAALGLCGSALAQYQTRWRGKSLALLAVMEVMVVSLLCPDRRYLRTTRLSIFLVMLNGQAVAQQYPFPAFQRPPILGNVPQNDNSVKVATTSFVRGSENCVSAASLGFKNDSGVTDNASAWTSYIASIGSANSCISFSAGGWYQFNSAIAEGLATAQRLKIIGNGAELYFPASNGISITYGGMLLGYFTSQFDMDGVVLTTGSAGLYTGLLLQGTPIATTLFQTSTLTGNSYKGHDGGAANYWAVGRELLNVSNVNMRGEQVFGKQGFTLGTGLFISGTNSATTVSAFNITDETDFFLNYGLNATGYLQGINVIHGNYTAVGTGIACTGTVNEFQCDVGGNTQISAVHNDVIITNFQASHIIGNEFALGYFGTMASGDAMINLNTGSANTTLVGNTMQGTPNGSFNPIGLKLDSTSTNANFIGNRVSGTNRQDIVGNSTPALTATGNRFDSATGVSGLAAPFNLSNLPGGTNIQDGANLSNFVTQGHLYGINTVAPATSGCGGGTVLNVGSDTGGRVIEGTTTAGCTITFNVPYQFAPYCDPRAENGTTMSFATTTTTLSVTHSSSSNLVWQYICQGT